MRAPVHDDGQIEAVFARLAKPVTAPGGAWVSQFSAVSEGVRRAISSSPQRSFVLRLSWKATSLKATVRAFYRCGLRGLASADLFDERLD